jgi:dihydroorotase (multifunctional complex type)
MLLKNGKVFTASGLLAADIEVSEESGKIEKIKKGIKGEGGVDLNGNFVLPGFIDCHVHFRYPGMTHKEDWFTGSSAAVNGGVTTVFDMPNTSPPTTTVTRWKAKKKEANKNSLVNFLINPGIGPSNITHIPEFAKAGAWVFGEIFLCKSVGDIMLTNVVDIYRAFRRLEATNSVGMLHCESLELNEYFEERHKGRKGPLAVSDARPNISELVSISTALALAGNMNAHICHLTTAEGLNAIRHAKLDGRPVTCGVTPHHLFLSRENLNDLKGRGKMWPPLRGVMDRNALWQGIFNGFVDLIETDHAPHLKHETDKEDIWDAAAGVPGVETYLALLINEYRNGRITLDRIIELTSENPAKVFGLYPQKGAISVGADADLVVVDPKQQWTVKAEGLKSKAGWTPYEGWMLEGKPVMTLVRGKVMMENGEIVGKRGHGAEVTKHVKA